MKLHYIIKNKSGHGNILKAVYENIVACETQETGYLKAVLEHESPFSTSDFGIAITISPKIL